MGLSISVEQVDPRMTLPLRRRVLRPHQAYDEIAAETDVEGLFAIGALVERVLVSCVVAHPQPFPAEPSLQHAWRLRGMATSPDHRGQGLGGQVLARTLDELRLRGAVLVWCNARIPAVALYERAGFTVAGEPWEDPLLGPHVRMRRDV